MESAVGNRHGRCRGEGQAFVIAHRGGLFATLCLSVCVQLRFVEGHVCSSNRLGLNVQLQRWRVWQKQSSSLDTKSFSSR